MNETIKKETANEFWNLITQKQLDEKLIFRGHGNSEWKLQASVFRCKRIKNIRGTDAQITDREKFFSEFRYFQKFIEHCDTAGYALPNDSRAFRNKELDLNASFNPYLKNPEKWPGELLYDWVALAQHYGVPTRFLDWTKSVFVAAYFAAKDCLLHSEAELALWTLNPKKLDAYDVKLIEVPYGYNKNIQAQQGCFTFSNIKNYEKSEYCLAKFVEAKKLDGCLQKITLPKSEAHKIIKLCKQFGVSGGTVFPDLYGAAKATEIDFITYEHQSNDTNK